MKIIRLFATAISFITLTPAYSFRNRNFRLLIRMTISISKSPSTSQGAFLLEVRLNPQLENIYILINTIAVWRGICIDVIRHNA